MEKDIEQKITDRCFRVFMIPVLFAAAVYLIGGFIGSIFSIPLKLASIQLGIIAIIFMVWFFMGKRILLKNVKDVMGGSGSTKYMKIKSSDMVILDPQGDPELLDEVYGHMKNESE